MNTTLTIASYSKRQAPKGAFIIVFTITNNTMFKKNYISFYQGKVRKSMAVKYAIQEIDFIINIDPHKEIDQYTRNTLADILTKYQKLHHELPKELTDKVKSTYKDTLFIVDLQQELFEFQAQYKILAAVKYILKGNFPYNFRLVQETLLIQKTILKFNTEVPYDQSLML